MEVLHPLVRRVRQWLRRHDVGQGGLVIAVSGGPDSVALLRLLLRLRERSDTGSLVMAHLNHQLRGPESDADETFVRDLHAQLAAEGREMLLRCERADVAAVAREAGNNVEATARRLRYAWLTRVAQEEGAAWVATGHTADDQAETVLHRLLRGAGIRGLRGIAARRPLAPGVELVRPLLSSRRDELLEFLRGEGQGFRQDSSNADLRYTRNRIRHELLPLLARQFGPGVAAVLNRLAGQADETFRWLERLAADLLASAERPRAGPVLVFEAAALAAAPRALVREMFRLVWEREGWPVDGMGFDGWERLAAVAHGERKAVDLPDGVRACNRGRVVQLRRAS